MFIRFWLLIYKLDGEIKSSFELCKVWKPLPNVRLP